jgi:hypothetical protein
MVRHTRRSAELAAMAHVMDRIFKELEMLAQVPDTNRIIRFKGNSINIRTLLAHKYVMRAPRLRFVLRGP